MAVLHTDAATHRLGTPSTTCERGAVENDALAYSRYWNWPCGCRGEIIAGSLIELACCAFHREAA